MSAAVFETVPQRRVALAEVPAPTPVAGEALVRVEWAALNHLDLWVRDERPVDAPAPFWGGGDLVGTVVALGPATAGPAVGTRVVANPGLWCGVCDRCRAGEHSECAAFGILGADRVGALAELVSVPVAGLIPVPAGADPRVVAAAPLAHLTAWRALVTKAGLRSGETLVVTGASGGVGVAAIQVAKLIGARVIAITRADKSAALRALGADVAVARDDGDPWAAVRAAAPAGVDVVLDSIGAPYWGPALEALAIGGRLVSLGRTAGRRAEVDVRQVFNKQLRILGTLMGTQAEFVAMMARVFDGTLAPRIDSEFPLARVADAFARAGSSDQVGKVLVRVAP